MCPRGVYLTRMTEMPFALRARSHWKLRSRSLPLGERTVLMGVLNTTPDSFSDGGPLTALLQPSNTGCGCLKTGLTSSMSAVNLPGRGGTSRWAFGRRSTGSSRC